MRNHQPNEIIQTLAEHFYNKDILTFLNGTCQNTTLHQRVNSALVGYNIDLRGILTKIVLWAVQDTSDMILKEFSSALHTLALGFDAQFETAVRSLRTQPNPNFSGNLGDEPRYSTQTMPSQTISFSGAIENSNIVIGGNMITTVHERHQHRATSACINIAHNKETRSQHPQSPSENHSFNSIEQKKHQEPTTPRENQHDEKSTNLSQKEGKQFDDTQNLASHPLEGKLKFILDGSNIARNNTNSQKASLQDVLRCRKKLNERGIPNAHIFILFGAGLRHWIPDEEKHLFQEILYEKNNNQAPKGTDDDEFIIRYAIETDSYIITNDHYKKYCDQYPEYRLFIKTHSIRYTCIGDRIMIHSKFDEVLAATSKPPQKST